MKGHHGFVVSLICVALGASGTDTFARQSHLGSISFLNSGNTAAQKDFVDATLLLHSFEYEQAANAYRRAQEKDPAFALAYWGEAMTYNHTVWMQQDRDAALAVLDRLAGSPEARAEFASTPVEKGLLHSVEILYGTGPSGSNLSKNERDDLYAYSMRQLHQTYPGNHEIATFYALAVLGTAHEGRDFATYMQAAAIVTPVWEANRDHPGAAHYLIHSYDDPIHAPLGLPMARAYSKIAPNAAHAQHMTSHIFVALGLWDDVIEANIVADRVQNDRNAALGRRINVCGHYTSWLEYGYLQAGRFEDARNMLEACFARQSDSPSESERNYFSRMRARYVFDTEDWDSASHFSVAQSGEIRPSDHIEFTDAVAALRLGSRGRAMAFVDRTKTLTSDNRSDVQTIYMHQLQGLLAAEESDISSAELHLQAAADHEASLPFEFGPPHFVKPAFELLGEFYLDAGMPEKAITAFKKQLKRTLVRTSSLFGLARAAESIGNISSAQEKFNLLEQVWHAADDGVKATLNY